MLATETKRLAYATMDDADSFALRIAAEAPEGDHVVELLRAESVEALMATAGLVRKMARTFFADKITHIDGRPDVEGPVGLFVVVELPELGLDDLASLSEEGDLRMLDE
jgi:hypothetical protein